MKILNKIFIVLVFFCSLGISQSKFGFYVPDTLKPTPIKLTYIVKEGMFNTGLSFESVSACDSFAVRYLNSLANFDSLLKPIFYSYTVNDTRLGTYVTKFPSIHIPIFSGSSIWEYNNNTLQPIFTIDNLNAGNHNFFLDTAGVYPTFPLINIAVGVGNVTDKWSSSFGNDNWSDSGSSSFGNYNTTNNYSSSFGNYNNPQNNSLAFGSNNNPNNYGISFGNGNLADHYSLVYGENNSIATGNVFIGYNNFGLDISPSGLLNFVTDNSSLTLNTSDTLATKKDIHNIIHQFTSSPDSLYKMRGWLDYKCYLTQGGTNPPTAFVVYNDFPAVGRNITWQYVSPGTYTFTISGSILSIEDIAFFPYYTPLIDQYGTLTGAMIFVNEDNVSLFQTVDLTTNPNDGLLHNTIFEIQVMLPLH